MRSLGLLTAASFVVLFTASCATEDAGKPLPDLNFSRMNAESVYVRDYRVEPLAEHLRSALPQGFVIDPSKATYDYFQRRYKSAGTQGEFRISVISASADYAALPSDHAISNFIDVAKKDRYTINVVLRLESFGVGGFVTQKQDIRSTQSVTLSEHASLAERERLQVESVHELILRLDHEVQKALKGTFNVIGNAPGQPF